MKSTAQNSDTTVAGSIDFVFPTMWSEKRSVEHVTLPLFGEVFQHSYNVDPSAFLLSSVSANANSNITKLGI